MALPQLSEAVLDRFLATEQPDDIIQVMYIWVDGTGESVRAKTRTIEFEPKAPSGKIFFTIIW